MSGHLGDRVAAVADDQLDQRERQAALSHLVGCAPCRQAVAAQREVSRRLAGMQRPAPATDLVQRLRVLATAPEVEVRHPLRFRAQLRTVAGVASVLVLGVGTAYAAGGSSEPGGPVRPAVGTFVSQHGTGGGAASLDDPAVSAVTASYHP